MAGTPVGAPHAPTFPASSPQSDQAGSPSLESTSTAEPEPPPAKPATRVFYRFQHDCHPGQAAMTEFTLKAGLVHRLLEHVVDVSNGVATWLETDERERAKPSPVAEEPAAHGAPDAAMRGLCVAALELIGDQARHLSVWVGDQQSRLPRCDVMPAQRRTPSARQG